MIGESERAAYGSEFTDAVAGLASGRGGTDAAKLAAQGVAFVGVPGPVDPSIRRALDSDPAIARVTLAGSGRTLADDRQGLPRAGFPPTTRGTAIGCTVRAPSW